MNSLSLITHLGLGDLILQSGLAVYLSKNYDKVYFPCRKKDYNSVRSFFLLQPKIEVVPLDTDLTTPEHLGIKSGSSIMGLGFYSAMFGGDPMDLTISFAENYYRQAGVDYAERWDSCPIQEVLDTFYAFEWEGTKSLMPARFIHDDVARGFCIKGDFPTFARSIDTGVSILAFSGLLYSAYEIHVIDSAFFHLAESIETTGELYLHEYARTNEWPGSKCPTRKKWNILK